MSACARALRMSGLEAKRDYTIIEAQFPAMRAMLGERKDAPGGRG
jgi:hypothetical protein